jgi:hypothetical protein
LWLGAAIALFGVSACGDDDGEDAADGTGGSSSGGMKTGEGGTSGSGGRSGSGGSSGAAPKGGAGGSSGGSVSSAGEGGATTRGGSGHAAGTSSGAASGEAGSGGMAGASGGSDGIGGSGGSGGSSGSQSGGSSGSGGSDAGSGGASEVSIEYRACERGSAVTRVEVYQLDRAEQTCTWVVVQQGQINCLEGLKSGGWCVIGAVLSNDVEACEAYEPPSDAVDATAGEGTFSIDTQPLGIDIDVRFEFPPTSGLPQSVSVAAAGCVADCAMSDCRP